MSVTFNADLSTDLDLVRFHLWDTVENKGPLPRRLNFDDDTLTALIADQGSWERAVAAAFDALAAAWQPETTFSVREGTFQRSDAAAGYRKQADEWRERYGLEGDGQATEGLHWRVADDSGKAEEPMFQRKAFGNVVIDWD